MEGSRAPGKWRLFRHSARAAVLHHVLAVLEQCIVRYSCAAMTSSDPELELYYNLLYTLLKIRLLLLIELVELIQIYYDLVFDSQQSD